jgi:hypothetical protein
MGEGLMATATRDRTPGTTEPDEGAAGRTGVSRAVVWTGIALGTAVAVLAMINGGRLRIGGLPDWLGLGIGAVIVWALIVLAAVTLAELARRHHKTARQYAIRQGKRGALATGRTARKRWRAVMARAAAWAGPRWQARHHQEPRSNPAAVTPPAPPDATPAGGATTTTSPAGDRGKGIMPMAAQPNGRGPVSRITPDRRARRTAARTGGTVPAEWGPVVAQAADFEPENDAHLLEWMTGQVTGMAAYAEALIETYETCVGAVGLDPKGLAAVHDVADAAAHAAETMSGAKTQFTDHYELPREFAGNGGLMPHDGRWVTGESG